MTNSDPMNHPMTRDELIELAPLDAFGLLDDYEAALFNRSFHHAPASVQAEILAIQAELAENPAFLASDEPRPLLRQKVLLRVTEEIEEAAEQLKPLAHIGAAVGASGSALAPPAIIGIARHADAGFAGDSLDGSMQPTAQDEAMRELVAEIRARSGGIATKDRGTPYWRAASYFLAAGLVVSLYFLARTMRTAELVAQLAQNQVINEQLKELVPNLNDFAYRDSHIRGMTSTTLAVNATATLYIDVEHQRALVLALGLSESKGPFTLRAVDERGNATVLASFEATRPVVGLVAENLPADLLVRKLELLDGEGRVILRTA